MTNFDFLNRYLHLQKDVMYDQLFKLDFATLGYCQADKSVYWNLALTNQLLTIDNLKTLESKFSTLDRKPVIYFENTPKFKPLVDFLVTSGYQRKWEDCWQFWEKSSPPVSGVLIKKVETSQDLDQFLHTFDMSYRKDDPQNPYGELGKYLQLSKESWLKLHPTDREEYFIAFKGNQPVSVATLDNYNGIGYICNVGSLLEVRGQGFGKAITLHCVNQSFQNGNTLHCLATESGYYPNEFYHRLGFTTKFTAVGYCKV